MITTFCMASPHQKIHVLISGGTRDTSNGSTQTGVPKDLGTSHINLIVRRHQRAAKNVWIAFKNANAELELYFCQREKQWPKEDCSIKTLPIAYLSLPGMMLSLPLQQQPLETLPSKKVNNSSGCKHLMRLHQNSRPLTHRTNWKI